MSGKIKILYILSLGTIGGAEKFVLSLCRNYDKSCFEVTLCVLFSGGVVSDEIKKTGHEVIMINMRNGFDFIRVFKLIPIIWRRKIDIVNIHAQNPLSKLCCILSIRPVIIHTDHGVTIGSKVKRKRRVVFFNRLLTPFIDRFIAISEAMRRSLNLRERVPHEKITLIYNGIEVAAISRSASNKSELKKSLAIAPELPVLGMVGRLVPEKQYPLLLESLATLKRGGTLFSALIIGDGPQLEYLKEMAHNLEVADRIKFLGQRDDVMELIDIMDVFVFSSSGEAFSITLLEAMAKAKPIVAFDVEGINEAVVADKTGFIVPFGDTGKFAEKIKLLLESPELAERMGRCALERVNARFNLKNTIKEMELLYNSLLQPLKKIA